VAGHEDGLAVARDDGRLVQLQADAVAAEAGLVVPKPMKFGSRFFCRPVSPPSGTAR